MVDDLELRGGVVGLIAAALAVVAGAQVLPPGADSDCSGQVPIVVASDEAAQSDLYSAATFAGVLDTTCIVLAGTRAELMDAAQVARLDAAEVTGWVIGGTAAVPDEKIAGRDLKRLNGVDRWHTARLAGAVAADPDGDVAALTAATAPAPGEAGGLSVTVGGAEVRLPPGLDADCAGQVPIVVAADAAAQSDIYSAVTLAGVLDTTCIVLAGARGAPMSADQLARLAAADGDGWIVGGEAAVPDAKLAGRSFDRQGGTDRWHTARLIGATAASQATGAGEDDAATTTTEADRRDTSSGTASSGRSSGSPSRSTSAGRSSTRSAGGTSSRSTSRVSTRPVSSGRQSSGVTSASSTSTTTTTTAPSVTDDFTRADYTIDALLTVEGWYIQLIEGRDLELQDLRCTLRDVAANPRLVSGEYCHIKFGVWARYEYFLAAFQSDLAVLLGCDAWDSWTSDRRVWASLMDQWASESTFGAWSYRLPNFLGAESNSVVGDSLRHNCLTSSGLSTAVRDVSYWQRVLNNAGHAFNHADYMVDALLTLEGRYIEGTETLSFELQRLGCTLREVAVNPSLVSGRYCHSEFGAWALGEEYVAQIQFTTAFFLECDAWRSWVADREWWAGRLSQWSIESVLGTWDYILPSFLGAESNANVGAQLRASCLSSSRWPTTVRDSAYWANRLSSGGGGTTTTTTTTTVPVTTTTMPLVATTFVPTVMVEVPQLDGTSAGQNIWTGKTFEATIERATGAHADCSLATSTTATFTVLADGSTRETDDDNSPTVVDQQSISGSSAIDSRGVPKSLIGTLADGRTTCEYTVTFPAAPADAPGGDFDWAMAAPAAQEVMLSAASPSATGVYTVGDVTFAPEANIMVPTGNDGAAFDVQFAGDRAACSGNPSAVTLMYTVPTGGTAAAPAAANSPSLIAYPTGATASTDVCEYTVTFPQNENGGAMALVLQTGADTSATGTDQAIAATYEPSPMASTFTPSVTVTVPQLDGTTASTNIWATSEFEVTLARATGSHDNCSLGTSLTVTFTVQADGTVMADDAEMPDELIGTLADGLTTCEYAVSFPAPPTDATGGEFDWTMTAPTATEVTLSGTNTTARGTYTVGTVWFDPDVDITVPTGNTNKQLDVMFAGTQADCVDETLSYIVQPDNTVYPAQANTMLVAYPDGATDASDVCIYAVTFGATEKVTVPTLATLTLLASPTPTGRVSGTNQVAAATYGTSS